MLFKCLINSDTTELYGDINYQNKQSINQGISQCFTTHECIDSRQTLQGIATVLLSIIK